MSTKKLFFKGDKVWAFYLNEYHYCEIMECLAQPTYHSFIKDNESTPELDINSDNDTCYDGDITPDINPCNNNDATPELHDCNDSNDGNVTPPAMMSYNDNLLSLHANANMNFYVVQTLLPKHKYNLKCKNKFEYNNCDNGNNCQYSHGYIFEIFI